MSEWDCALIVWCGVVIFIERLFVLYYWETQWGICFLQFQFLNSCRKAFIGALYFYINLFLLNIRSIVILNLKQCVFHFYAKNQKYKVCAEDVFLVNVFFLSCLDRWPLRFILRPLDLDQCTVIFRLANRTIFALIDAFSPVQSLLLWPHLHNHPCPCGRLRQGGNQCGGRQAGVSGGPALGQSQFGGRWEWRQLHVNQMIGDSMRHEFKRGVSLMNPRLIYSYCSCCFFGGY